MFHLRKICIIVLGLLVAYNGFGQIFGGNPSSIKWKQINTSNTRVIFPAGLDSTAARITNVIDWTKRPTETTIGTKSKKINILLQNRTTISNGFVALAPYKSEFYLTPAQNSFELGSLPWADQLTIHEYRHVEQYNNFNVGLSHVLYLIFGEEGQALANNASIPNWFFEGDAVYTETNASKQGRGGMSYFYNGYRALWKDGRKYNWMKLRNGSYKDFVPDHYPLGYMLVAYGREKYGDKFWKNVTHDAASYKGLFYPMQKAIKKYSGNNYSTFRKDAFDFFKKELDIPANTPLSTQPYVNEEYPAFSGNNIIYVKSSYKQIPEFIIREGNTEKKIRVRDNSLDNHFNVRNGKIVYAAYRPGIRWGYSDYSEIQLLDIARSKQQTLTRHTKYFSPDISPDGKTIVTVEEAADGKCALVILDINDGHAISKLSNPGHLFFTYPKFYTNNTIISAVRDTIGKMSLAETDIETGNTKFLMPFTFNVIGFPSIYKDSIYFTYAYKKKDELLCFLYSDKKLFKINSKDEYGLGKYEPAVNDSSIVWSTFTSFGYKLVQASKKELTFEEMDTLLMDKNTSSFGVSSLNNINSNLLYSVEDNSYKVSNYSRSYRLFNFHSIQPNIDDPDYTLTLLGENIINTLQSQLSFTYNRTEQSKKIGFGGVYGALFPYLSAGINYTFDRRTTSASQKPVYFNELEPYAGFNIPLNFSKGRSFTFLNFGTQYVYNESAFKGAYKDSLGKISYSYASNFLSFSHQNQKARQEIFPGFAQTFNATYKSAITHYSGNQFTLNGNIYLPGFFKTHSLVLNAALLAKDSSRQINFSNSFPFSRGYNSSNFYRMFKWGINYHFPFAYPDAGFGNIFYLLRVRANLFYDGTYIKDFYRNGNSFHADFRSSGTEINFDTKWWNQANVSVGFRYSYLFNKDLFGATGNSRWEIILPVNIFNQ
ncbi:MAG: hypothetical protein ABIN25_03125 [Ginsengibacter sp.]